ncbi:galactose mutarotase isoform X2 [Lepeophtheirus salmonis]|uniref:galactose mutarotase isoform X2 n=1 Tax=Lepeophtheirus salmonis TaxID=72036 RepID=UPI001AE849BC|nr:galactose mutarotase-like isoform X2 [Lepeophtheirus salmonis]
MLYYVWYSSSNPYMGSTVGRVCNRIGNGKFHLGEKEFILHKNDQNNSLHGGKKGFDKCLWKVINYDEFDGVVLRHKSPDGNEGYPSTLFTTANIKLNDANELKITYTAESDGETPINLTNHTYFNLGGESSGAKELFEHDVTLYADKYTPVNESNKLPTGIIEKVDGTPFDLRTKSKLGTVIPNCPGGDHAGFDHNYVFDSKDLKLTAKVSHPSGNKMECWTNQLGLQFYTGNHLGDDSTLKGKSGIPYEKYGGFCLEAQNFPDAINNDNFPSCILEPGKKYESIIIYKFDF